ncbi:MAG TPA: hypothetical protein VL133_15040 [Devosia sp.]|nr:hypothetical protein [Devosia sp.]
MTTAALTMTGDCTLVARPHPFDSDTAFTRVPAGQTLAQMLGPDASHSLSVAIGGHDVPSKLWAAIRPKAGQTIHVTAYPQGGNAGKWVRLIAIIVISYFTFGAGGAAAANGGWLAGATGLSGASLAAAYAAIGLVGMMAVTPMIGDALEIA